MDNDWTKDLSKRMEEHRLDGFADGMWPDIEKAVLAQQAAQKRRPGLVWLRRTAVATAAAAAVAAVVWLTDGTGDVARQVQSAVASQQPGLAASRPSQQAAGAEIHTAANVSNSQKPIKAQKAEPSQQPLLAEAATPAAAAVVADTASAPASQPATTEPYPKVAAKTANQQRQATKNTYYAAREAEQPHRQRENKWSVGLYAFNSPSKISLGGGETDYMVNSKQCDALFGDANAVAPSIGVADVELHHKQPVSFGATARYKLGRWLSVEAGLAYTYLSADYADEYMSCEQRLHYVGVPVKLNCDLYSGGRFDVYVTAGTMAEKLVSGRRKTEYPAAPSHNVATDVREGGLQWSVKGALGLAFNATPTMAVYVEPGVGHYIDNGSRVQNFYKSSPTCFNLLVGLRFTPHR